MTIKEFNNSKLALHVGTNRDIAAIVDKFFGLSGRLRDYGSSNFAIRLQEEIGCADIHWYTLNGWTVIEPQEFLNLINQHYELY